MLFPSPSISFLCYSRQSAPRRDSKELHHSVSLPQLRIASIHPSLEPFVVGCRAVPVPASADTVLPARSKSPLRSCLRGPTLSSTLCNSELRFAHYCTSVISYSPVYVITDLKMFFSHYFRASRFWIHCCLSLIVLFYL